MDEKNRLLPADLDSIDREKIERFERAKLERPWRYAMPIKKLRDGFHMSRSPIRLVRGPNRGSKTTTAAIELICFATGYNHFRDEHYPIPNVCWASTLDHKNLGPVQEEIVASMCPKGFKYNNRDKMIELPPPWNSKIYFKVCEAGWEKYQGQGCLAIWQDEEWPDEEGLKIFKEMMRRTRPGWPLRLFMTLTPLSGYTWSYDYLSNPESKKRFKGVEVFNFNLYDCAIKNGGFYTDEQIEAMDQNLDPFERQARIYGEYSDISGNPAFSPSLLMAAMARAIDGQGYRIRSGYNGGVIVPTLEKDPAGDLVIIHEPVPGREYIIGADPSMGVHRDRSVASVWDRQIPVEVAYFASNSVDPVVFARDVLIPLSTYYNNGLCVVENNSTAGGGVITAMQGHYGNVYMQQTLMSRDKSFTPRYGWRTDLHSRGLLFATFKDVLRFNDFMPSEDLAREAMNMIVDEDGKIDHQSNRNDDHVLAACIALTVSRMNPAPVYGDIGMYRETYNGENAWLGT